MAATVPLHVPPGPANVRTTPAAFTAETKFVVQNGRNNGRVYFIQATTVTATDLNPAAMHVLEAGEAAVLQQPEAPENFYYLTDHPAGATLIFTESV